jgi:hypothetical protein
VEIIRTGAQVGFSTEAAFRLNPDRMDMEEMDE